MAHRDRPTVVCSICHKPLECDPRWEHGKLVFHVTAVHACMGAPKATVTHPEITWPREEINQ